jgi:TolB-like protein
VQSLLRVIQQRKLDRVAAAYSVAAWLVVQACSIALPTFGAPPWVLKVLIVLAVGGLPLTLWIAWLMAPARHYRHHHAPPPLLPSRATDVALLALLAGVIILSGVQILSYTGLLPGVSKPGIAGGRDSDVAGTKPSIAVLPFINMSGDPSKEYFSDGISEELLNRLANAPELRVAARTSSFAFKGKREDIRQMARALNVEAVLEGSVREDGQHIRITAQLINAADGFHVWSKTYDRDLSNILQVQDEIARAITASMTHALLRNGVGNVPISRSPFDPEAYRQYLQANALAARKTIEDDMRAIELFKSVINAEPKFAPAYAALGRTYVHSAEFQNRRADLVVAAEAALDRALALDGSNLEALSSHLLVMLMKWEWPAAAADAHRLQALNPHSVYTLRGLNAWYASLGFPEQQSAVLREATRLDPLSFVDLNNLATAYNDRGQFAEAVSAANDALARRPGRALTLYTLCVAYAGLGRENRAQMLIHQLLDLHEIDASQGCALKSAAAAGRMAESRALADAIAKRFPAFVFGETNIANFYLTAGDFSGALQWLSRAYDRGEYDLFAISYLPTTPRNFLKTPGWIALKQKPEGVAWQAAHDRLSAEFSAN